MFFDISRDDVSYKLLMICVPQKRLHFIDGKRFYRLSEAFFLKLHNQLIVVLDIVLRNGPFAEALGDGIYSNPWGFRIVTVKQYVGACI